MNELTGAVGRAQLQRLPANCHRRTQIGDRISKAIGTLPGIIPPKVEPGSRSTYWFYMFRIDAAEANVDSKLFSEALAAEGIPNQRGYIPSCIYEYELFTEQSAYIGTQCPFKCQYHGKEYSYHKGLCPTAEEILETSIRFSINEFMTDEDADEIIRAITKVSQYFSRKGTVL